MGRMLPTECEHGTIIDYGGFGPCQGYCDEMHPGERCPDFPTCEQCEDHQRQWRDDLRLLIRAWRSSTGLKRNAGFDPQDVNAAALRLEGKWLDAE